MVEVKVNDFKKVNTVENKDCVVHFILNKENYNIPYKNIINKEYGIELMHVKNNGDTVEDCEFIKLTNESDIFVQDIIYKEIIKVGN